MGREQVCNEPLFVCQTATKWIGDAKVCASSAYRFGSRLRVFDFAKRASQSRRVPCELCTRRVCEQFALATDSQGENSREERGDQ